MYVSWERKQVFLAQPHTASRATANALLRMGFVQQMFRGSHHAQIYKNGLITPDNRREWFAFSTVRNPFDLLLSRVWKQQDYREDVDWSNADLFRDAIENAYWITDGALFNLHRHHSDRLLRYETLARDLSEVVGPVTLPTMGENPVRRGRHYREFYTPETRALVEERFGDEMKELGYAW